ncbi:hypothetical protein [Calidifontibacter indicus]|uniref:DUF4439 domain-containing protein n=1 Tax=Calidifontibacter indicus TaxID=419650 RepID=A0A3D9UQH5_9MICO|nr:hypothetical protein [Calidifontibacter indicus]REF30733.1 hypothetical protein DFJ65_1749 [Calidifontibacter indicus]
MPGRSNHPTRRTLLLAGLALPLAGCGIRVERDAPEILGIPTLPPPADSTVMQDTVTRLRQVAGALAGQDPAAWTAPLRALHTDQADRLTRIAASAGIEISAPATSSSSSTSTSSPQAGTTAPTTVTTDPAPTSASMPGGSATSSGATASTVTVHPASTTETAAFTASAVAAAAAATGEHRPALLATLAGHRCGARVLGATDLPVSVGLPSASAAAVLEPVRLAVYVAETLIAKTAAKDRTELSTLLSLLTAERMRLGTEAGTAAKPEQLSYALPSGTDDPAHTRTTMARLVHDCATAVAAQSGTATTTGAATRLVQLWGDLTAAGWQWGQAPDTFLGLR